MKFKSYPKISGVLRFHGRVIYLIEPRIFLNHPSGTILIFLQIYDKFKQLQEHWIYCIISYDHTDYRKYISLKGILMLN